MANTAVLGIYTTNVCLSLASILPTVFLTEAAIGATATILGVLALLCGSFSVYRGEGAKGGVLNLVGGGFTVFLFAYFAGRWRLPLLLQPGPLGLLLLIPAPISGVLAILASKLRN